MVLLLSASLARALGDVSLVKRRLLIAGGVVAGARARASATRSRGCSRGASAGSSGRPTASPTACSTSRSSTRARTRSASSHERSSACADAWRSSTTPGASSSRTRRTSCERRVFSLGGFLELLDDEELDEETRREFLATMREQVQRLEKLATELLDLSRLDAGQIDLDREAVALNEVGANGGRGVRGRGAPERPRTRVDAAQPVLAVADEQRLLQIARILVENALDSHAERHARAHRGERGARRARLSVSDDGPGIDEAEVANIFERFYRVDGAQASGSGLGLAIARELARLMGGSLELERSDGRTSFAVTLRQPPVCRRHDTERRGGRQASPPRGMFSRGN